MTRRRPQNSSALLLSNKHAGKRIPAASMFLWLVCSTNSFWKRMLQISPVSHTLSMTITYHPLILKAMRITKGIDYQIDDSRHGFCTNMGRNTEKSNNLSKVTPDDHLSILNHLGLSEHLQMQKLVPLSYNADLYMNIQLLDPSAPPHLSRLLFDQELAIA